MVSNLTNNLNYFDEFKELYFQIINDFGFDYQDDCKSRNFLSRLLTNKSHIWNLADVIKSLQERLLKKTDILIYGCGPSLEETVGKILRELKKDFFNRFINIAANGASVFLREKELKIDAIFTDLDGITKKEFYYSDFNIVHAHGDNINKLEIFRNDIINFHNIIGTTQVEPLDNVISPGGFTDGDRIVFFLRKLINPSQKLFLIGMDFQNIIGKYSKLDMKENREGTAIKKKKLQYGIKLLEWIIPKIKNEIYFVNSGKISQKFNYISIENFLQIYNL